ncbi:MAG: hypothetical protein ACI9MC_002046 [Kiritimatiellia bacterium]|jgi:hypothetical protein
MGQSAQTVFARLHALVARDAPTAVVLRRGPSNKVATIGWDLRDDTFTLGQWYRGRIYPYDSDISPDGTHWIYFALNGKRHEETKGSYTVLARTPYLKALGLWPVGSTWGGGGGLFSKNGEYWPFSTEPMIAPPDQPRADSEFLNGEGWYRGPHHLSRLVRDGWTLVSEPDKESADYVHGFTRPTLGEWVMGREVHIRHEVFELRHPSSRQVIALDDWEWADVDVPRERLVWASQGCMWSGQLASSGLVNVTLLADLNDMRFHRTRAPY